MKDASSSFFLPNSLKKQALRYAAKGFHVLPVHSVRNGVCSCHDGAQCAAPGKHPTTVHGSKDATTDRKTIRDWWTSRPDANIGIATGKVSNLIVLDVDGKQGRKSLAELFEEAWQAAENSESQDGERGALLSASRQRAGPQLC